jgi:hypothetical protein
VAKSSLLLWRIALEDRSCADDRRRKADLRRSELKRDPFLTAEEDLWITFSIASDSWLSPSTLTDARIDIRLRFVPCKPSLNI